MRDHILFDHDGVLVDTERWYFRAAEKALAEVGFTLDPTQYLEDMKGSGGSWAQARRAGVDEDTIALARVHRDEYYQQFLRTEHIEVPGVLDVLRELQPMAQMGIVTTSKRVDFELIHRNRHIVDVMQFVLMREDFEHPKPSPDPYLMALARSGARPQQTIVVEDSERGLRSAMAAGIDCAIVHNDFTATHDFTGAAWRIATLAELPELIAAE